MLTCDNNQGMKANSLGRPIKPCGSSDSPCPEVQLVEYKREKSVLRNTSLHPSTKDMDMGTNYSLLVKCECDSKLTGFNCFSPCSKFSLSRLAVYASFTC